MEISRKNPGFLSLELMRTNPAPAS
ncbi:uncharacterized protein METZ01_LOCUS229424 [marine metagenome]|uniref:Uncharacterized protein n=1 Tax=marine metagenome TaxID=408172 RepID=A0A382GN43_9ZZZZ